MPELTLDRGGALTPAPFWRAAKALQGFGYTVALAGLFLVIAGGGGAPMIAGFVAVAAGSIGTTLAERLSPLRALKGVRVRDVMIPSCRTVPHYTRLQELIGLHRPDGHRCVCVVTRDGRPFGLITGEDIERVDPSLRAQAAVEWFMHPVDWIEAVDAADNAAQALNWLGRYRREFLPVLNRNRVVGIVRREDILQEARARG